MVLPLVNSNVVDPARQRYLPTQVYIRHMGKSKPRPWQGDLVTFRAGDAPSPSQILELRLDSWTAFTTTGTTPPALHDPTDSRRDVRHAEDGSDNSVRNGKGTVERLPRKREAETAGDDAESHEHASVPDVDVADHTPAPVLEKVAVVEVPEEGLHAEQGDDGDTHPRVRVCKDLRV